MSSGRELTASTKHMANLTVNVSPDGPAHLELVNSVHINLDGDWRWIIINASDLESILMPAPETHEIFGFIATPGTFDKSAGVKKFFVGAGGDKVDKTTIAF